MVGREIPRIEHLPIKLIMPRQGKERKVEPGGGPPEPFREVDATYRRSLSNQISAIQTAITPHNRADMITKASKMGHQIDLGV